MNRGSGPLAAAARAVLARRRRELVTPPSPEELIAYHEGRLAPTERERVERALGAFPEAARALRDMAAFPAVAADQPADRLSPEQVAARWQAFRRRLAGAREAGEVESGGAIAVGGAAASSGPPVARRRTFRPGLRWLIPATIAAVVLLAAVAVWRSGRSAPRPAVNVAMATLSPLPAPGERGGAGREVSLPAAELRSGLLLRLDVVGVERYSEYRLAVAGAEGRVSWRASGLRRRPDDTLTVFLPPALLAPGRYRLELSGVGARREEAVEAYGLAVTP